MAVYLYPPRKRHFYPRSPRGERRARHATDRRAALFLSTLPARGATSAVIGVPLIVPYFYPRSPRGERLLAGHKIPPKTNFYPRSPRGERQGIDNGFRGAGNISIHAPREGSDPPKVYHLPHPCRFLSTLPARGATIHPAGPAPDQEISIHAPREGSDAVTSCLPMLSQLFLSTLPARGATSAVIGVPLIVPYFYPRSPRGERRHGPAAQTGGPAHFYPRSPRGERQPSQFLFVVPLLISIHAPREGSDEVLPGDTISLTQFLSTLPARGATRASSMAWPLLAEFLSTLPARGATASQRARNTKAADFYPRSPRGERPLTQEIDTYEDLFLSTLPARGATRCTADCNADRFNFYPRSPRGERLVCRQCRRAGQHFYPRSPRGERPGRARHP